MSDVNSRRVKARRGKKSISANAKMAARNKLITVRDHPKHQIKSRSSRRESHFSALEEPVLQRAEEYGGTPVFSKKKIIQRIVAIYKKHTDEPLKQDELEILEGLRTDESGYLWNENDLLSYLAQVEEAHAKEEDVSSSKKSQSSTVEDCAVNPDLNVETQSGSSTPRRLLGGSEASIVQPLPAVETETTSYSGPSALTVGIVSAGLLLTGFILRRIVRRWSAKPRPVAETNEISIVVRDSAAADLA